MAKHLFHKDVFRKRISDDIAEIVVGMMRRTQSYAVEKKEARALEDATNGLRIIRESDNQILRDSALIECVNFIMRYYETKEA